MLPPTMQGISYFSLFLYVNNAKSKAILYRDLLRLLWKNENELFGQLYPVLLKTNIENPSDVFFLDVISVMPPKFRPVNIVGGIMSDNKQTAVLRKIVQDTYIVKTTLFCYEQRSLDNMPEDSRRLLKNLQGETLLEKLQTAWHGLQENVNMIVDTSTTKDAKSLVGFKQVKSISNTQTIGSKFFPPTMSDVDFREKGRALTYEHDG